MRSGPLSPPSSWRPRLAISRGRAEVAALDRSPQVEKAVLVLAEPNDQEPRPRVRLHDERPCREQEVDALRDDHLPDEDDARALSGGEALDGVGRPLGRAIPAARLPARPEGVGEPPQPIRRRLVAERREEVRVDAREARASSSRAARGPPTASHSDSAVWREPTRTPDAASMPSRA